MSAQPVTDAIDHEPLDEPLFTRLYSQYEQRLIWHCTAQLHGDYDLAQDMAQQTWIQLWRHGNAVVAASGAAGPNWLAWLLRVASNFCISHHRREAILRCTPFDPARHETALPPVVNPEAAYIQGETLRTRIDIFNTLTARDRRVLISHYWHEVPIAIIAERERCRPPAIKSVLERARNHMAVRASRRADGITEAIINSSVRGPRGRLWTRRQVATLLAWADGANFRQASMVGYYTPDHGTETIKRACRDIGCHWSDPDARAAVAAYLAERGML